ncbi:MAG TPA: hypothetical protein VN743_02675, partial [Blastocatellia bacterium]|nr:hypothetical protein [Blastocatellia bacterium]
MKSKIGLTLLFLFGFVMGLVLMTNDAHAQQTPDKDKTQAPAATAQNGSEGPYTVTSSIEFGVRGVLMEGNGNKYRSDLNYTPGFR